MSNVIVEETEAEHDDRQLRNTIVAWIKDNRNVNTNKSYTSSFGLFVRWCKEQAPPLPFDPPTEAVVAMYARDLVLQKNAAFSTVNTRLAAIADDGRYNVASDERGLTRSVLVQQMMKCLRPMTKSVIKKLPLTMAQLHNMAEVLKRPEHDSSFVLRRNFLMVVLASVTLLRRSEVVRLEMTDVSLSQERIGGFQQTVMSVFVNKLAKNDIERKGHTRYVLEATGRNAAICPIRLYKDYVEQWRSTKKWLFYQERTHAQLSSSTPNHGLKKLLAMIGLEPNQIARYGFHSCRRGGATLAAERGIPIHLLKRHGNWRSDAVYEYIEDSLEQKTRVSTILLRDVVSNAALSSINARDVQESEMERPVDLQSLIQPRTDARVESREPQNDRQQASSMATRAVPERRVPISSLFMLPAPRL